MEVNRRLGPAAIRVHSFAQLLSVPRDLPLPPFSLDWEGGVVALDAPPSGLVGVPDGRQPLLRGEGRGWPAAFQLWPVPALVNLDGLVHVLLVFVGIAGLVGLEVGDASGDPKGPLGDGVGVGPASVLQAGEKDKAIDGDLERVPPGEVDHLVVARVVVEVGPPLGLDVGVGLGGLLGDDIDGDELLEVAEESLPELEILPEVQAGFGLPEVGGYFVVELHLESQLTTIGLHLSFNKFTSHLFADPIPAVICCLSAGRC